MAIVAVAPPSLNQVALFSLGKLILSSLHLYIYYLPQLLGNLLWSNYLWDKDYS